MKLKLHKRKFKDGYEKIYMEEISRKEFKKSVLRKFQKKQSVAVFAPKYFGKSTFLHSLHDELAKAGETTVFLKLECIFSPEDLFEAMRREIQRIFDISFNSFQNDIAATEQLKDVFIAFGRLAEEAKRTIYFFIDEFDEIEKIQSSKLELNSVFNDSWMPFSDVIFCLSIKNSFGIDIFRNPKSSLYGFAEVLNLPKLSNIETASYLVTEFNEADLNIDHALIGEIIRRTNNLPFYVKSVCRELILSRRGQEVTEADLNAAIDEVYRREKIVFMLQLKFLRGKKHGSAILLKVVKGENPYDLVNETGVVKSNIAAWLSILEKENLIYKNKVGKAKFTLFDPFLRRYILEIYNVEEK